MNLKRNRQPPSRRQRIIQESAQPQKLSSYSFSQTNYDKSKARKPNKFNLETTKPKVNTTSWLQRAGFLVFLVSLIASLINVLSLSSSSIVIPITNNQDKSYLQSNEIYAEYANQLLNSSPLNKVKLTADFSSISSRMKQHFPELSTVSIGIPLVSHRPIIYVEPIEPGLILNAVNGSFVIGTDGNVLAPYNSSSTITAGLPVVTDQSGLKAVINKQFLPATEVNFIQIVVGELTAKKILPANIILPTASSEMDVHLTGEPYFIKFNIQNNNPADQAGTFLATISNLQKQNITPAEYVDVRVDGRAYYK